jgi:hypothetical protein
MIAIDKLIEEVRHLPEVEDRRALLQRYEQISDGVKSATERFRQALLASQAWTMLVAGEPSPDISAAREALRKAAKDLRQFIEEQRVSRSSQRDEKLVTAMKDGSKDCLDRLNKAWQQHFEQRTSGYRQLADAAQDAALPGAATMQHAVIRLERLVAQLPASSDIVALIAAALEEIRGAIERLGLEGRAGKFLIEAARTGASIEQLFDPEVKQFLDTNAGLRRLLKVRLA